MVSFQVHLSFEIQVWIRSTIQSRACLPHQNRYGLNSIYLEPFNVLGLLHGTVAYGGFCSRWSWWWSNKLYMDWKPEKPNKNYGSAMKYFCTLDVWRKGRTNLHLLTLTDVSSAAISRVKWPHSQTRCWDSSQFVLKYLLGWYKLWKKKKVSWRVIMVLNYGYNNYLDFYCVSPGAGCWIFHLGIQVFISACHIKLT